MNQREMSVFQITVPFQLDWKYVVPYDYETLEYFLTPELSLIFKGIVAGRRPFYIGAHIDRAEKNRKKFAQEVMPQRSQERIQRSFKDETISAFFTLQEAKVFEVLFKEEEFICRHIEIHHNGRQVTMPELLPEDFDLVESKFVEMKVSAPFEFSRDGNTYSNVYHNMYEKIDQTIRNDRARRQNITKEEAIKKSAVATGLILISATCAGISRKLFARGGWIGFVGGIACAGLSVACGVIGKGFAEDSLDYLRKGWFARYV